MVALRHAWYWRQWRPRTRPSQTDRPVNLVVDESGSVLSERASRAILAAYGVPLVRSEWAGTPDEAARAADRIGFPVVVKADAPGVAHKASAGLIRTGIASAGSAGEAAAALMEHGREAGIRIRGVLVQATAAGVELICGMRRDPAFGPVVLIGLGGTLTEVLRDLAVRLCPVAEEDLEEMLDECAAGGVVAAAGADPGLVLAVVDALSRLALDHPEVREVDVNPLFAGPAGVAAADALIVMSDDGRATESKGATA